MKQRSSTGKKETAYGYQAAVVCFYALLLLFMFGCVLYRGVTRGILGTDEETNESAGNVDWAARYPFADSGADRQDTAEDIEAVEQSRLTGLIDRYTGKVNGVKATLEWYCTDGFVWQQQCIEISALVNRLYRTDITRSAEILVRLKNGYITPPHQEIDTTLHAENVRSFAAFLEDEQIPLMYVESLFKVDRSDNDPLLYDDYSNRNADRLIEQLRADAGSMTIMDLRETVEQEGLNHYALFFRTDTHWLPSTGLWAAERIAGQINEIWGFDLDTTLLREENYRSIYYPDQWLGSSGRNVGLSYTGPEDFTLLVPDFSTDLTYTSEAAGIQASGSFEEALIDWSRLENRDYYGNSCYAAYMSGRQPLARITNNMADNELRILLLTDSFGTTVAPFLALTVEEIDFLDPRLFSGSLEEYIRQSRPDAVVMMYNPEVITSVSPDSNDSIYMLR